MFCIIPISTVCFCVCKEIMNCLILISFFLLSFASNLNSVDAQEDYGPSTPVLVLTSADFKDKAVNSNSIVLVEFYAPWCRACKVFTPIWEKTATVCKGVVTIAAINVDEHKDIGQEYKISMFPTIKAFVPGKPPVDYTGPNEGQAVVEFADKQVTVLLEDRLNA